MPNFNRYHQGLKQGLMRLGAKCSTAQALPRWVALAMLLCALWAMLGLVKLFWLVATPEAVPVDKAAAVLNPLVAASSAPTVAIDINKIIATHLFGQAGLVSAPVISLPISVRDGIEKGAKETGLSLTLRGVVTSSADGMGYAMIESQGRQQIYAINDELPLSGKVTLAKVMPNQVVLDNNGEYELLSLFDESVFTRQVAALPKTQGQRQVVDQRLNADATAIADTVRTKLYTNPQSLASLVRISAVRDRGQLVGYQLMPGEQQREFQQLGFKSGDIVTAVNGLDLTEPANAIQLYRLIQSATQAEFELQRDTELFSISVSFSPDR